MLSFLLVAFTLRFLVSLVDPEFEKEVLQVVCFAPPQCMKALCTSTERKKIIGGAVCNIVSV